MYCSVFAIIYAYIIYRNILTLQHFVATVAVLVVASVSGQRSAQESYGPPQPFQFAYASQDPEGSHSHSQQGDANGRITGEYSLQLADGRQRIVK